MLYFTNQNSGSNSMNCSSFNKYTISWFNFYFIKNISYCIIFYSLFYFFFWSILGKPAIQICSRFAINNIPHFILSKLIFNFQCIFIIRMYLNRQCLPCINKFYQNRKSIKWTAFPTQNFISGFLYKFTKIHTFINTISNYWLSIWMCRKFPTFANNIIITFFPKYCSELCSAP